MTPIFTNKWPPICTQYLFGRRNFIVVKFCTKIESLTIWPPFFLKTEDFTKRPPSFSSPQQMTPYFSFVLIERPLFLYLVCHCKTSTLMVLSAHPRHFHMWVPPGQAESLLFHFFFFLWVWSLKRYQRTSVLYYNRSHTFWISFLFVFCQVEN